MNILLSLENLKIIIFHYQLIFFDAFLIIIKKCFFALIGFFLCFGKHILLLHLSFFFFLIFIIAM